MVDVILSLCSLHSLRILDRARATTEVIRP